MLKPLVFGLYVRRLVLMSISARDEPRQNIICDIRPGRPYTVQCSTQTAVVLKKIAIFRVLLDKQLDAETIARIQFIASLNQMLHISIIASTSDLHSASCICKRDSTARVTSGRNIFPVAPLPSIL